MEWITYQEKALALLKKYRYVLIILLVGILLMLLPADGGKEETIAPAVTVETQSLQDSLTALLEQVSGAGKVAVLLTESVGEETVYQVNEDSSTGENSRDIRRETVLISDAGREKAGLVRQVKAPTYLGAVVVCQGADSAAVRLAIVEAVKSATGLSSDCISVLKMK